MKKRNAITLLAAWLLILAQPAWSLGLGDARVESFLGQPLTLRIELLAGPQDDLDSISAQLASADDFALIGASRGAITVPLGFTVREDGEGAYIAVSSRGPVSDPVLRLVVEVNWASGRLLREYTVFLDPPTVPAQAPPVAPEDRGAAAATTAPPVRAPQDVTPPEALPPAEGEYGPVQNGETLWRIASNWIGDSGLDMNQVMLAIQRRNPDAFLQDNINLLKRGAVLQMPTVEDVQDRSASEARELVAQQEAAFRLRSSLASTSTPLLSAEAGGLTVDREIGAAEEADLDAPQSRLEIVPASEEDFAAAEPGTGAVPGGEVAVEDASELREELARTEEELLSERQQNTYLRERISELEAQLQEAEGAEGLVADQELADLEERLRDERLAEAEVDEAAEAAVADESEAVEPPRASTSVPSVTTARQSGEDKAWYSSALTWVIIVLVVGAGLAGWFMSRRRADAEYITEPAGAGATGIPRLQGEAQELARAREQDRTKRAEAMETGRAAAESRDKAGQAVRSREAGKADREAPPGAAAPAAGRWPRQDATPDAQLLDESSSDPEIKLDLARAYISMGDKEAARIILEEVVSMGSEEQKSEAKSMMDEL